MEVRCIQAIPNKYSFITRKCEQRREITIHKNSLVFKDQRLSTTSILFSHIIDQVNVNSQAVVSVSKEQIHKLVSNVDIHKVVDFLCVNIRSTAPSRKRQNLVQVHYLRGKSTGFSVRT